MLIKAESKFVRVSPKKIRLVRDAIRKISSPDKALIYLAALDKRASIPLIKTIKQAIANGKNNLNIAESSLRIKEIQITDGPIYKRFRPVSRGMAHPYARRTSHIRVILEAEEIKEKKAKIKRQKGEKSGTKG